MIKNAENHLLANEMAFDLDKFRIIPQFQEKRIPLQCGSSSTKETKKSLASQTQREIFLERFCIFKITCLPDDVEAM